MRSSSWLLLPASLLATIVCATNHVVTVGKDAQLKFDPETLAAHVGDTITYQFFAKVSKPESIRVLLVTRRSLTIVHRTTQWSSPALATHAIL